MAAQNFGSCLTVTLAYEGGLSLAHADPGNWTGGKVGRGVLKGTNFGIAASTHPNVDISGLTRDEAARMYRQDYWDAIGGDAQPLGLDLSLFDAAVNSGVRQAKRWLVLAKGPATRPASAVDAIHAYADARLSFLHALGTWKAFGRGWGARVAGVEAKSLRMALDPAQDASQTFHAKATRAKERSVSAANHAKLSGATALIAPAGLQVASRGDHIVTIMIAVVAVAAVAILSFVAWRHAQRATALALEGLTPLQPSIKEIA